jgi:hypothetical protein
VFKETEAPSLERLRAFWRGMCADIAGNVWVNKNTPPFAGKGGVFIGLDLLGA